MKFGASPRAALSLASAVKARALMQGRCHASFEDTQALAQAVLGHRLVLDYSARIEGKTARDIVAAILEEVPVTAGAVPRPLQRVAVG